MSQQKILLCFCVNSLLTTKKFRSLLTDGNNRKFWIGSIKNLNKSFRLLRKSNVKRVTMSLTLSLVCLYIIIGLCFLLFVNYKFLKRFITSSNNQKYSHDTNRNNEKIANNNTNFNNNNATENYSPSPVTSDVWSIPGPLRIPFLGTKWIYLWKYKMSKIHEVYWGTLFIK